MSELFDFNFETGDFSQWNTQFTSQGNTIDVNTGSKFSGVYGLEVDYAGIGGSAYTQKLHDWVWTTRYMRFRFYLNLAAVGTPSLGFYYPVVFGLGGTRMMDVRVRNVSGTYTLRTEVLDDSSSTVNTEYALPSIADWLNIEVLITRSSATATADGRIDLWVDDTLQSSNTSITLFDQSVPDRIRAGSVSSGASTGVLWLDDFVVRDDNTKIGPIAMGNPAYYYNMMQQRR